jgi:oligogalacturonide lyase
MEAKKVYYKLTKAIGTIMQRMLLGMLLFCSIHECFSQTVEGIDYSSMANVDNTFDMAGEDVFGQRFPSEHLIIEDEVTGVPIVALTTSRHNNSKIYQTHPQWTPDGKYIVFRSDRAAKEGRRGQAYAVSMDNYEIVQVTTGDIGSELHLGWKKNMLYFFRDGQLIELELGQLLKDSELGKVKEAQSYERIVTTLPEDIRETDGMGLDANEERIFFVAPLSEELSAIYSIALNSGKLKKLKELPFRASHLQANPWISGEIMYCWETGGDAPQRMWYLSVDENGKLNNRPVYREKPDEWVTHEVFAGPDHILFNVMAHVERLKSNQTGIFSYNLRTGEVKKFDQAEGGGYWHAAGTKDLKWAVGDTFNGNLNRLNLKNGDVTLLTTGHRPNSKSPFTKEAHSHHSISPDGKWVLFNSSMLTSSDIMMVPLFPENLKKKQ